MANPNNVINVALLQQGRALARDNMNICALFTADNTVLSSSERVRFYTAASQVSADFGSDNSVTRLAQTFFAQQPNPINADGLFVAAFWRATDESVAASAAVLRGEQLSEDATLPLLQAISDGSFNITVDATPEQTVTGIDLRTAISFTEVASTLNTAITGATVTEVDGRFIVTSATTGATSALTFLTAGSTGTFLGPLLGLDSASAATLTSGAAADTLSAETKVAALDAARNSINFKGFVFEDNPTDVETRDIAAWCQANDALTYDVFDLDSHLQVDTTNIVWELKLASRTRYRCLYSPTGNRNFPVAYMSRMHVVNFAAENSAITMNLKELNGIVADDLSQTVITQAQRVGLDIYVAFKRTVPRLLTSGANDFTDNPYNLIAYVDAMSTDLFNILGQTATKIPQTERGVNQLVDQAERTTRGFVTAGIFAPGTWTSTDRFGDEAVFNRNIEENGFYVLARPLSEQTNDARQRRESPVIQVAVKNAGAIHSVNVIVNFNL